MRPKTTRTFLLLTLVIATLLAAHPTLAQTRPAEGREYRRGPVVGIAPTRAADGYSIGAAAEIQSRILGVVSGPAVGGVALTSNLAENLEVEARQRSCDFLLYTVLSERRAPETKRSSKIGVFRDIVRGMDLPGLSPSARAKIVVNGDRALGSAQTVADLSTAIRPGDEIVMTYRLVDPSSGRRIAEGDVRRVAESPSEDIVSPAVDEIAARIAKVAIAEAPSSRPTARSVQADRFAAAYAPAALEGATTYPSPLEQTSLVNGPSVRGFRLGMTLAEAAALLGDPRLASSRADDSGVVAVRKELGGSVRAKSSNLAGLRSVSLWSLDGIVRAFVVVYATDANFSSDEWERQVSQSLGLTGVWESGRMSCYGFDVTASASAVSLAVSQYDEIVELRRQSMNERRENEARSKFKM